MRTTLRKMIPQGKSSITHYLNHPWCSNTRDDLTSVALSSNSVSSSLQLLYPLNCWVDEYHNVSILLCYYYYVMFNSKIGLHVQWLYTHIIYFSNFIYFNKFLHHVFSSSNNKATLDPSRKFLLSCKDKLKQAEENRSSGICLQF